MLEEEIFCMEWTFRKQAYKFINKVKMKKIDERNYQAEEGKVLVCKSTGQRIGTGVCLGENDFIENYEESLMTEEEIQQERESQERNKSRIKVRDTDRA